MLRPSTRDGEGGKVCNKLYWQLRVLKINILYYLEKQMSARQNHKLKSLVVQSNQEIIRTKRDPSENESCLIINQKYSHREKKRLCYKTPQTKGTRTAPLNPKTPQTSRKSKGRHTCPWPLKREELKHIDKCHCSVVQSPEWAVGC